LVGSAIDTVWLRLGCRVAELARLLATVPDRRGTKGLVCGALPAGELRAISWCEMSRGLLMHWVELRDTAHGPMVGDYRIVSPTDWNFHPRGAVARTLERFPASASLSGWKRAAVLAAAYDPCVAYQIGYANKDDARMDHA
ncbi:nickel-dependent hydrogenase large subunit, partial [Paraburkholderia piptadeniae]|uniref:nickel-dependent hydrogenase large subunit n=1 Tax=Paraburkholderia piptadeniae TaxID=1701573 RepID=UPI00156D5FBB